MNNIYWIDHLFWCLGAFYLSILRFDFKDAIELHYFIRIHLCYKSKLIGRVKLPFKRRFKNLLISLFGFCLSILILIIIGIYVFLDNRLSADDSSICLGLREVLQKNYVKWMF